MTFDGRTATSLVMLGLFVGACVMALDLPAKAAFMPLLIGVPGALLCAAQLGFDLLRPREEAAPGPAPEPGADDEETGRSELHVFAWFGGFCFALIGFGFVLGGPLIVTAYVRFSSRESWTNALVAGGGTLFVLYGVFNWLLELSLFDGLILGPFL